MLQLNCTFVSCYQKNILLQKEMDSNESKSGRNANFTEEEETVLADLYAKNAPVLQGKFSDTEKGLNIPKVSMKQKQAKWREIRDAVNAVGNNNRTVDHLIKKIKNMRSSIKKKAASNKLSFCKTGGGSDEEDPPDFVEAKILSTISRTSIFGIPGGVDVHAGFTINYSCETFCHMLVSTIYF